MSYVWKKHKIGKRILALCLLLTMLLDTVTASAMTSGDEENTQIEIVENITETEVVGETETQATRDVEEIVKATENLTGIFENIEIVSSFYQVKLLGGTFTAVDEEASYEFYVASYNSNDERLLSSYIGSSTGSKTFGNSSQWNDFAKGTEYLRIEAYLSASLTEPVACSEKIYSITEPDFSLVVSDVEPQSGRVYFTISGVGDFAITTGYGWSLEFYDAIQLIYGTSEDESTWATLKWDGFYVTDLNSGNEKIYIGNLEDDTTYYSKIFYEYKVYDDIKNSYYTNFEQTIYLEPFTTKESNTYNLKTVFPDSAFRNYIIKQLGDNSLTEESDVTIEQLEKITRISYARYDGTTEAVRDITGIELLPNLTQITLTNNEISNIDAIDWSVFEKLNKLYLGGNNITKLPDWGDPEFYADLRENMLPEDDVKRLKYSAETWDLYRQVYTQRSEMVELELEETYYVYGEDVPIVVNLMGEKFYTPKIFIDDVETAYTQGDSAGGVGMIIISESNLAVGEHTIKVELYDGETKVRESQVYNFNVVEETAFLEDEHRYLYCSKDSSYNFRMYFSESKNIQTISVTDDDGSVFAQAKSIPSSYTQMTDLRHKLDWIYLPKSYVYYRDIELVTDYDAIPKGEYNIQITYSDGTIEVLKDNITVVDKADVFYDSFGSVSSYRSEANEYYINLYGQNIEPEKFDYIIVSGEWYLDTADTPLIYCGSKKTQNGYIVKLKGEIPSGSSDYLSITPKNGYEVIGNFAKPLYSFQLKNTDVLYYSNYNLSVGKLELGINPLYQNQQVAIEVRTSYSSSSDVVATGEAVAAGELTYIELYNTDGTEFAPEYDVYYYFKYTVAEKSDSSSFYISSYNEPISKVWIDTSVELPVTITVYELYDIEPIEKIVITDRNQLKYGKYGIPAYYFEQSFINSLSDQGRKYEVVAENAAGLISSQKGYLEYEEVEEWTYTVDRTELDIYQESESFASIAVTGNRYTPTFSSTNRSVAEIVTYGPNSSNATILAVGVGTTEITITADGITKSFTVTVISTDPNLPEVGEFRGLDIIFSGYNANRIYGTFVPNTEEYYELYLVSYNNLDEKICSSYLMDADGIFDFDINSIYFDTRVAVGASYVRVEAYVRQNGEIKKESVSEKFMHTEEPEFIFVVDDMSVGAGSLNLQISYAGDLATIDKYEGVAFWSELSYGTSEDETTWTTTGDYYSQVSENKNGVVLFTGLDSETTYYGKIRFYDVIEDLLENKEYLIFEQTIFLEPFKTAECISYNLKTEFPDAVLRNGILTALNDDTLNENSSVTNSQLESIQDIYLHRYDETIEPVRDLTGIELLVNLRGAVFSENEIDIVDNIDWSKLANLEYLYLCGNNITRLPDLSKNTALSFVDFNDNMLSKEELYTIYSKIPLSTTFDSSIYTTQRVEEIEDEVEWRYAISRTKYNLDKELEKTGTLQVYNASKNPTFKSSDTTVATIEVSKNDPSIATITAVGEGIAEITITVDGESKWLLVKVYSSVPKVQAQSNVVINTFFGNEAKTALEITNSFNTAVKKVTMTEAVAGLCVEQIDGTWYLCSDGSVIAKNTKVTLAFEVEGFEAIGDLAIAPQTITVNGVSTQPAATLSAATIDFNAYPYTEKAVDLSVKNNDYRNIVVVNPEDIVLTAVPKGVNKDNAKVTVSYDAANAKIVAKASDEATNGTYKFTITPGVGTDGVKKAKEIVLTVNLKATKPEFKFNTSSVSLDAAYPGESEGSIKLLMDEGYVLDVEGTSVLAPNDSVNDFINVEKNTDGTITFRVTKAGLSTAGTYKITAKVKSEWGSTYELKEAKVTVKVTNSSKVTLSSKSKSVTINPYVGYANVKANLAVKGFTAQDSVEYTTYYSYVPTNELAKNATDMRLFFNEDGTISIAGCSEYEDGKYTYNLLGTIVGNDGTVTYTKPLVFTVQLKAKTLTIVPSKKSVTVYADYCTTVVKEGTTYYKVEIPVNVKEDAGRILNMALTNSMETSSVSAKVEDSILVVEFPTTLTKLSNVTFTAVDTSYAAFKASITVNTKEPKPVFTAKKITMNRYTDATVTNTVVDTEGYSVIGLKNVVINKGKNVDATGWFSVNSTNGVINGSTISISIPQEHDADIVNGDYTVSLTPVIKIGENEKELPACTFTLKVAQPKVKLGIGNIKTVSQTVNLYPSIDEKTSEKFEVKAYVDNKEIAISGITVTTKDKTEVTNSTTEGNNIVSFTAVENTGKNTYVVTAKVKKANGVVEEEEVTLNKAFVVNVKELPTSIKLAKKKLTFSPYVESKVSTTINSPELASLMKTGDFTYRISAVETNSKYKDLAAELKNNILSVTGSTDGIITVDNTGYVTKNTTFYYLVTVELMQKGKQEAVATYTDKLSVVVKNTLPKAELQLKSISLDNAFVSQNVANRVMLTTGSGLWTIDALTNADIVIKSGSKDVTSEGYFNVTYDGSRFTVGLNNKKADGTLITVPKGSYKFEIIPKVSERNGDKDATLAKLTLTVKVTSNRPTIKMASKVTVKVGQATQYIEPTLKNNGTLTEVSICTCTKYPNKADETDVAGIEVKVMSDGNISVKADAGVMAGSYTFTINPVTIIDGKEILLDAKKLTVVVK